MLYLSNILEHPYSRSIQVQSNDATDFINEYYSDINYRWFFENGIGYDDSTTFLRYNQKKSKCTINGYIGNIDNLLLRFMFEIRVTFRNKTDFLLVSFDYTSDTIDNEIDEELELQSRIKKFDFIPYSDKIYFKMCVIDVNSSMEAFSKPKIRFNDFGFNIFPSDYTTSECNNI